MSAKDYEDKLYKTAAKVTIKYGSFGNTSGTNYPELLRFNDYIKEMWQYDDPMPSIETFRKKIEFRKLKWYIHNKIQVSHKIWNSDFIFGLTKHGKISWGQKNFPSFLWRDNPSVDPILKDCPYGGTIGKTIGSDSKNDLRCWSFVPALYLKHSEGSLSFMAGVFSAGQIIEENGQSFAVYGQRTVSYLKSWNIPIEKSTGGSKSSFLWVSPIWPALFAVKMPPCVRNKWNSLKNPCKHQLYAPAIWRLYVGEFKTKAIPYLPSRRTIFYRYGKNGMKKLEDLTVSSGLMILDPRIKEIVQMWSNRYNKENGESASEISSDRRQQSSY